MTTTPRTIPSMLIKIALVTLLAVATAAYAQQPGPGGPGGPARPGMGREMIKSRVMEAHREGWGGMEHHAKMLLLPKVRKALEITDEQAAKIKDALYNGEKQKIPLEAQVKLAKLDLKQLMTQNRPDQAKVMAQIDTLAKAKTDLAKAKVQEHLAIRAILTDQQIEKIKAFMQEHAAKRGMRGRGEHGPWGRGGFGKGGPRGGFGKGGPREGAGGAGMPGMSGRFGQDGPRPAFNEIGRPGFFGQDGVNAPSPERLRQLRQRLMERRNREFGGQPAANPDDAI